MRFATLFPAALILQAAAAAAWAADPRPIALIGVSYGRAEIHSITEAILLPQELVFKDFGGWMPIEDIDQYGLVIYATAADRTLTEPEIQKIGAYLKSGGQVLFINMVPYSLGPKKSDTTVLPWVGTKSIQWLRNGEPKIEITDAKSPIVGHVRAETLAALAPIGIVAVGPTTLKPLISGEKGIVVGANAVGRGTFWFAGPESFRLRTRVIQAGSDKAKKAAAEAVWDDYIGILRNIIVQAKTLTRGQSIARGLAGLADPVIWFRDPGQVARGAEYLQPAYPEAKEVTKEIRLDLCRGEWETFRVYLSCVKAQPKLTVSVSDLVSPEGGRLAGRDVRIRMQGLAVPELVRVGPFWLLDGEPAADSGRVFDVPETATRTFWFTLRTHGLAAGEYAGTIRFQPGGEAALRIKVHPVDLPPRSFYLVSATTHWGSLPGGNYRKGEDFALYEKYVADLGEHHISFDCPDGLVTWSSSFVLDKSVLRDDGTPFREALQKSPERFRHGELPALDLSAFDPRTDIAGRHGLVCVMMPYRDHANDFLAYSQIIYGKKDIEATSPEHTRIRRWCMGELLRFFRERGYRVMNGFVDDEQPPEAIPDMVRRATEMKAAGWNPCATITGMTGTQAKYYHEFNPAMDYWILNLTILDDFWRLYREDPTIVDASDQLGTYVADWHRAAYMFNRKYGWLGPYFRLDRWFIHGYLRWYENGGAIWPTPQGPIATEGWEGARDGIEDGRLFALLLRLTAELEKKAGGDAALAAKLAAAKTDLTRFVGIGETCFLTLNQAQSGRAQYLAATGYETPTRQARALVLKHLTELLPYWDVARRNVSWGGLKLIDRGEAKIVIVAGPHTKAAEALATQLAALGGGEVPIAAEPKPGLIPVFLGSRASNPALAKAAEAKLLGVTDRYPAAGRCVMLEVSLGGGPAVALYAVDEPGLAKAVGLWPNFLDVDYGLAPYDRAGFARSLTPDYFPPPPAEKTN